MASKYAGRVLVYSIVGCPHCKTAKATLSQKSVPYTEISVDKYEGSVRESLRVTTGKSTVPQIFFNEIYVGGNEELQKLVANEAEWQKMLDLLANSPPDGAPQVPNEGLKLKEEDSDVNVDFVCEPDEFALLVEELKKTNLIGDHRKGLFKQKNTFSGQDFVKWLMESRSFDEATAIEKGQNLLDNHFANPVKHDARFGNDDKLYRLVVDDDTEALNHGEVSQCAIRSVNDLGEDLRKLILKIYGNFLSDDGRKVDYAGIAGSEDFKKYQTLTVQLQRVKIEEATREEKLAFFINVYNALVIHANVVRGPPTNLWQRYKFFNSVRYIIGGHPYNLQEIENGVLRANRKGVGMIFHPFGKGDPRLKVALHQAEPLIHFALVCGAKSCPPIKTYSADGVMDQLRLAAQAFLEGDDVKLDMDKRCISVSKIFSWYKQDFGGRDESLVEWLVEHMSEGEKKENLHKLFVEGQYSVTFLDYDWSTNS